MRRSKQSIARRRPSHRPPAHPGEILLDDFLEPLGLNQREFADHVGMSVPWVNALVRGRRNVTVETAFRLAHALGTTAEYWLNMQQSWDLWHFTRSSKGRRIGRIRPIRRAR